MGGGGSETERAWWWGGGGGLGTIGWVGGNQKENANAPPPPPAKGAVHHHRTHTSTCSQMLLPKNTVVTPCNKTNPNRRGEGRQNQGPVVAGHAGLPWLSREGQKPKKGALLLSPRCPRG